MKLIKAIYLLTILCLISCENIHDNQAFKDSYSRTSDALNQDSIQQAFNHCKIAIELASNPEELGKAYWMNGYLYDLNNDPINAQTYYTGAADAYIKVKNYSNAVKLLQNAGTIALNADAYTIALDRYRERLQYAIKVDDKKQIARGNYEIGLTFLKLREFDSANHYQNNVLDLVDDDAELISDVFIELGIIQFHLEQYDSARLLYKTALRYHSNPVNEYKVANNIANSYLDEGKLNEAKDTYQSALKKGQNLETGRGLIKPLNGLGKVYYQLGKRDSSLHYLKEVYSVSTTYANAESRKKLYKLGLSRSPLYDLGANYQYLVKLDPEYADQVAQESIMDHMTDYLTAMEVMVKENDKRAIQLANANRKQSRLTKRLEEYQKAENLNRFVIGLFCIGIVVLLVALFFHRRGTIADAKEKLTASSKRVSESSEELPSSYIK